MNGFGNTAGWVIRWVMLKFLRAIQLLGLVLVAVGAYPFTRPFVSALFKPPVWLDSFVQSFGIQLFAFGESATASARGIVFIAIGAVLVWVATSNTVYRL